VADRATSAASSAAETAASKVSEARDAVLEDDDEQF
jgi:hypothetical protein